MHLRIFIGESDRCADQSHPHHGKPIYEALLHTFRGRSFARATVGCAIAGFGASARMHTAKILRLALDLPIIVEVVETEEKIRSSLASMRFSRPVRTSGSAARTKAGHVRSGHAKTTSRTGRT